MSSLTTKAGNRNKPHVMTVIGPRNFQKPEVPSESIPDPRTDPLVLGSFMFWIFGLWGFWFPGFQGASV